MKGREGSLCLSNTILSADVVQGLDARLRAAPPGKPEDRDAWLRLANARKVLGENDKAVEAYARADAIAALAPAQIPVGSLFVKRLPESVGRICVEEHLDLRRDVIG